jgi:hypothetical protein
MSFMELRVLPLNTTARDRRSEVSHKLCTLAAFVDYHNRSLSALTSHTNECFNRGKRRPEKKRFARRHTNATASLPDDVYHRSA